MSLNYLLQPNYYKDISVEQLDSIFVDQWSRPNNSRKIFEALDSYFASIGYGDQVIQKYYKTYWKYYVWCTWNSLNTIDSNRLAKIIPKQFTTAFAMNIKVTDKLFNYIYYTIGDGKLAISFYRELRNNISSENSYINSFIKKDGYRISDIYSKFKKDIIMSTIEKAELTAELKRQLFYIHESYYSLTEEEQKDALYRFLSFFDLLINVDDIVTLVLRYTEATDNPDIYLDSPVEEKDIVDSENVTKSTAVRYDDIIADIRKQFTFDSEDQTPDFGVVLSRLDEIAKEKNDPAIAELYYFDENSGKFKWNINN